MSSEGSSTGNSSFFKSFAAAGVSSPAGTAVAWVVRGALSPQQFPAHSPRSCNDFRAIEAGERRSLSSSNLGVDEYRPSSAWSPVDTVMKLFEMTNDMGSTVRKSPIAANRFSDYVSDESKSPSLAVNRPNTSESRTPVSQTIININIPKSPQPAGQTVTKIILKSPSTPAKKSPQPAANGKAGHTSTKLIPKSPSATAKKSPSAAVKKSPSAAAKKSPSAAAKKSPQPAANGKAGQTSTKLIPKSPSGAAKKSPQPAANGKAGQSFSKLRMKIADKLSNATYDCMICLEMIAKWSPVVACKRCHVISHLRCLSALTEKGHAPVCPGCRKKLSSNLSYRCFCEKKINPMSVPVLTPHTCGATCGKKTSSGKSCELFCHPGPCD